MIKIVIASGNPAKINAALDGFKKMFPEETFETQSVSVPSGVSNQPMTDIETIAGATNRAINAATAEPNADFYVGMEGGVEEKDGLMEAFAWIVIRAKDGKTGKGRTGTFFLPKEVSELVKQGKELGEADDIVFSRINSKQTSGAVGILTHDVIDRATYYSTAIVLALIPFRNKNLY